MVRTQISLTEAQLDAVRREATRRGLSMSGVVRAAVNLLLDSQSVDTQRGERRDLALGVIGRFASGSTDGSHDHDRHLADAFQG
jgi:Arc/MetJ-type ribon-helix-helix transcriptional regulator